MRAFRSIPFFRIAIAGALIVGMATTASAQQQSAGAPQVSVPSAGAAAGYQVGPGDTLGITVYRSPQLTTVATVAEAGTILFPELGPVSVGGMTSAQIAQMLQNRLRSGGIVVNPSVNVIVSQVRARLVSVMGAVARPGEFPLDRPNMTLSAVLAQAGATFGTGNAVVTITDGNAPDAPRRQVRIADIVSGVADAPAKGGQILTVQAAPTVYVSGEVGRPGAYPIEPNMTVGQALALAGGVTPRGSSRRVRLTRKQPDGSATEYAKIKMDDPVSADDLIVVRARIF